MIISLVPVQRMTQCKRSIPGGYAYNRSVEDHDKTRRFVNTVHVEINPLHVCGIIKTT